jgi:hypothetical protein
MRIVPTVIALAGLLFLPLTLKAQARINSVEPPSAKAGDIVSAAGESIDKSKVDVLYLTDGTNDIKVAMTEQTETLIKFKVPAGVKPGRWALMIKAKGTGQLIEQPVKVTIE